MTGYDRASWEDRWADALRRHGERLAERPPNAHLTADLADLPPGRALDAGCGHGAETLWLALRGWRVTAVDFAAAALAYARASAEAVGAERIEWVEADLSSWVPPASAYDLVVSLYVHVAGSVEETVQRLASGVAPGGTLFLVGHHPTGQLQVSVEDAAALDSESWEIVFAEERPRPERNGVDAVIRARRL